MNDKELNASVMILLRETLLCLNLLLSLMILLLISLQNEVQNAFKKITAYRKACITNDWFFTKHFNIAKSNDPNYSSV